MSTELMILVGVSIVVVVTILAGAIYTVQQRTVAIIQRLGKFVREAEPGIHLKIPILDRVVGRVNLRVQQLDVRIETKTHVC